ncbi:MAG: dephospho-CoA kinase [Clostridia bacterium]|nr:dephospho-CoA kinase [Clostridia bacterium]
MLVIGLTGPTGAGKGVVSDVFAAHGIPVINADDVYHALLIPPSACLNELVYTFGPQILTPGGTLDRRALGELVFSDEQALTQLNQITHAYVMAAIRKKLDDYRRDGMLAAVLDAPQLFEAGANKDCNIIVSVLADKETRVERIVRRDGIEHDAALRRMASQKSDEFFRTHSDYIIENNDGTNNVLPAVRRILEETGVLTP